MGAAVKQYLDDDGEPVGKDSGVTPPAGYSLISSKKPTTSKKTVTELKAQAAQRKPISPPSGYVLQAAPSPSVLEQLRNSVANSAIGYSLESTLPKLANMLNLHPSETVNSPTYASDKEQLVAPQYATDAIAKSSGLGQTPVGKERLEGGLTALGGLTSAPNMALMAGTAVAAGLTAGLINPASAQLLSRLVSGGFSLDMLYGLYQQHKEYKQAVDSGNLTEAHKIQGEMGINGIMALLAGHHALTSHPFEPVTETPDRVRTNVLHRNTAGEVRQAKGQAPTVWLSPDAWKSFMGTLYPGEDAAETHGINLPANADLHSFANDPKLSAANPAFGEVQNLLAKAHENANEGGVAVAKQRPSIQSNVNVMREELNHTWQRSLADNGNVSTHLNPQAFTDLYHAIPSGMYDHLVDNGYSGHNSPEMVTEAAAKLMDGRPERFGVDQDDAVDFLDKYFSEVTKQHGAKALEELQHVRGIAADAKARAIEEHGRTGAGQDNGTVSGVAAGGQGGAGEGVPESAFNREKVKDEATKFQSELATPKKDWEGLEIPSVNVDVLFPPPKEMEPAWIEASQNPLLHDQFKRTGISGFTIEEPYKFGLSEQGNIDPKTGKIAINAAASNPTHTLAHEVAHDIYRRLTPENRQIIDGYVGNSTHIHPEHTGGLEERIVDHFADEIARPMSASAPPSIRKIFFESPLEPRPVAPVQSALPAPPEPKRPIYGTWSDVARSGGNLRMGDDIRGLVAKDGDFPLVLKDTYGARHIMPASVAADVLDSPAHNYVREVFMAKDHLYDTPRLAEELEEAKKMLAAGRFMGGTPETFKEPVGRPLTDSYRKELQDKVAKGEKILADRKAGIPHRAIPVVPVDTIRTQTSGARMLTDAINTFGNRNKLAAEYKTPQLTAGQDALFNREKDKPIWYLKSERLIGEKMRGPMPAEDVGKMLLAGGVKPEEMHWTGLDDFLKSKGNDKVTPEEIREHLANNNLQIKEIQKGARSFDEAIADAKGDPDVTALLGRAKLLSDRAGRGTDTYNSTSNLLNSARQPSQYDPLPEGDDRRFMPFEAVDRANKLLELSSEPKFGKYVLPGGENYREMLLTLPPRRGMPLTDAERNELAALSKRVGAGTLTPTQPRFAELYKRSQERPVEPSEVQFKSSHWDEPNVLAHVRFNDRTGPNGERLLHLEEAQSDWAKKIRKEGVKKSPEELAKLPMKATRYPQGYWEIHSEDGQFVTNVQDWQHPEVKTEADAIKEARRRIIEEPQRTQIANTGQPDMPWKKNWHEQALRRMLKKAVDEGYSGLSWTGGADQAERYSLSSQVDKIAVPMIIKDGSRSVRIDPIGGGNSFRMMVSPDGTVDGSYNASQFTGKKLDEVIGKEMAKRIMEAKEPVDFSGEGLKVGGEGMHGFYDKIVPDYLNKFGKKYGAKVGEADLGGRTFKVVRSPDLSYKIEDSNGVRQKPDAFFETREEAQLYADELQNEEPPKTVQYLPITPEMRKSVAEEGVPLFNREQVKTPEFKSWFGDSRVVDEQGEPRVVYHGTNKDFDTFDIDQSGKGLGSEEEKAIFFTTHPDEASAHAQVVQANTGSGANVVPVYLRVENPYISPRTYYNSKEMAVEIAKAKEDGHDGIIYPAMTYRGERGTIAVFDPKQVKSAIGNSGAFDPNDPNILRNRGKVTSTPEFQKFFEGSKVVDKDDKPMVVYHGTRSSKDFSEFSTTGPVADEEDEEQPLSSGSGADPTAFMGAHFAQEPSVANRFAEASSSWMKTRYEHGEEKPRIIPAYLSVKNPKVFGRESNLRSFIYLGKPSGYAADAMTEAAMQEDGLDAQDFDDPKVEEWQQKYDNDKSFRHSQNRWLIEYYRPSDDEEASQTEFAQELANDAKERLKAAGYDGAKYFNEVEGGTSWIAFEPEQIKSAIGNSGAFDPKDPNILRNREKSPDATGKESVLEPTTATQGGAGTQTQSTVEGSPGASPTTVIPVQGGTVLAAAPKQSPVAQTHTRIPQQTVTTVSVPLEIAIPNTPVAHRKMRSLAEIKAEAAGRQRQPKSVREVMREAKERMGNQIVP